MILYEELSEQLIGAMIEVHRHLGPGLLESAYLACLCRELDLRGIPYRREVRLPVVYKGLELECGYRIDLIVDEKIVLEAKSIDELAAIHEAQLTTYLRLSGYRLGFVANFNVPLLKDGLIRRVL